jgi:prepilin-type processing-associated H-X9-DG protein
MRRQRFAFSLVELLCVIGILTILVGILMPAMARARREARKTACKAQLANLAAAMQMYLNDNDGWYPQAPLTPAFNPPPERALVSDYLRRYVSNVNKVFRCPGDEYDDNYFERYGLSYSYYEELGDRRLRETFIFKVMRSSSTTPVMWDAEGKFHAAAVPSNWLFADGHVDAFLDESMRKLIIRFDQPH